MNDSINKAIDIQIHSVMHVRLILRESELGQLISALRGPAQQSPGGFCNLLIGSLINARDEHLK